MLQNARVTAFTASESLRENQQGTRGRGGGVKLLPPSTKLGLSTFARSTEINGQISRDSSNMRYITDKFHTVMTTDLYAFLLVIVFQYLRGT